MFTFKKKEVKTEDDWLDEVQNMANRGIQITEVQTMFSIYSALYNKGIMEEKDFVQSTRSLLSNFGYEETLT